jgi:hypothetical protein
MEPIESGFVGHAHDPVHLGLKAPSLRRFVASVDLQLFWMGVNIRPERAHEIRVRKRGGHNCAGQKDRRDPLRLRR